LPRLEPVQLLREALPEPRRILRGVLVDRGSVSVGVLCEPLSRGKFTLLSQEGFNRAAAFGLAGHEEPRCGVRSAPRRAASLLNHPSANFKGVSSPRCSRRCLSMPCCPSSRCCS